jgi:predicted DNA-binding transcriptional regulator YafY
MPVLISIIFFILYYMQQHQDHNPVIEVGFSPIVEPPAKLFRDLLDHIQARKALKVTYRSWNHPEGTQRVIHPHSLAFSNIRWHVRAFDEKTNSFRDFHLGRVADYQTAPVTNFKDATHDQKWNTFVTLVLIPNPVLSKAEQHLVRADYAMKNDRLELISRLAMSHYLLQAFNVQVGEEQKSASPREFPLFLENKRDVETGLFGTQTLSTMTV